MKLNYNPDGWVIADEEVRVPESSPYRVETEHDYISGVEIYTAQNRGGTKLTEGTDYTVDYNGEITFRRNTITFSSDYAGQTLYVWYKTIGDIVEADDFNILEDRTRNLEVLNSGSLIFLYTYCKGVL
jgi:uncharacterized surface anchored protein